VDRIIVNRPCHPFRVGGSDFVSYAIDGLLAIYGDEVDKLDDVISINPSRAVSAEKTQEVLAVICVCGNTVDVLSITESPHS
jgi:hypothetical protein